VRPAIGSALAKLDPRVQLRNPVMFVVWVVSVLTTLLADRGVTRGTAKRADTRPRSCS
jgi:K+-transporting ATPase ATPase B chain